MLSLFDTEKHCVMIPKSSVFIRIIGDSGLELNVAGFLENGLDSARIV